MNILLNNSRIKLSRDNVTTAEFKVFDRRLKIAIGDFFTVLSNNGSPEAHFMGKGYINKVAVVPFSERTPLSQSTSITGYTYTISSVSYKEYSNYNELDDYAYSLRKIYRYEKPWAHFRSTYTSIELEDAVTLQNEWIYISRTVFGRLLNALPRINKLDFVSQIITQYGTNDLTRISYTEGLKHLQEYIDEKIFVRGRFIQATRNVVNQNFSNIIERANNIGFLMEGTYEESLFDQAALFDRVFELQEVFDTVKQNLEYTARKNIESTLHFDRVFKGNVWPIDLNRNE